MLPYKPTHRKRLKNIFYCALVVMVGLILILDASKNHINYYLTPTDIINADKEDLSGKLKLGGLIQKNSIVRENENVSFILEDENAMIYVQYRGSLPSLFKEGQGAIIEATLENDQAFASRVFVKHDENYSPPKVSV